MQDDALFLDAEPELREPLLARLARYIIADDATLDDVTDDFALLHLLRLDPQALGIPGALRSSRFGEPGWDIWLPRAAWDTLRGQLPDARLLLSPELLELLRLEAGIPRWGRELGEDTLPPEAGLEHTHVDYHKGCYIGQETISRLKSVGHVNRQLTGFFSLSPALLAPHMRLFAAPDAGKPVGQLTSAAYSFALAKPIALGYLRRGSPTEGLLARPAHAEEPAVEVAIRPLPSISS